MFNKREKILEEKLNWIIKTLEESNMREFVYILGSKKEIIKRNIMAGISRGVGIRNTV